MIQELFTALLGRKTETSSEMIFPMSVVPLSKVPFHDNTPCIDRYFANKFPMHLAVHEVSPIKFPPPTYTQLHVHEDADEVNIIISNEQLIYEIRLGDDLFRVENNSSIWIPRGIYHSANVISGAGFFITLRLD